MLCPQRAVSAIAMLALAACESKPAALDPVRTAAPSIDWSTVKPVTVKLTDFDFTPSQLSFQAGQPVRLLLSNSGSGLHDFSAPSFFAAASFRQGAALPAGGKVAVAKGASAEVDLVPGAPGQYPLECTEFLHTMLGMTGKIAVSAAQ